jgi:nitrite reductase/ring-hydroxylating ferredoxin subunit
VSGYASQGPDQGSTVAEDGFQRLFPLTELELDVVRKVTVDGREMCVVRTVAGVYAFGATCPHQGAPMCEGRIRGTMDPSPRNQYQFGQDGEVIACPWHGYEFNVRTGESVHEVIRGRLGAYPVQLRDGDVFCSPRRLDPNPARRR